jgi:hypothetical protein
MMKYWKSQKIKQKTASTEAAFFIESLFGAA